MPDVPAVPAASVIVLRDGPLEVLMLRRHGTASFAPNAWVFPGGVVDASDERGSVLATMRLTAARELFEETGIWLGAPLAGAAEKRRALLAGAVPFRELLDLRWITPAEALGSLEMIFPTVKNLEAIRDYTSSRALIESRIGADIRAIQPAIRDRRIELP